MKTKFLQGGIASFLLLLGSAFLAVGQTCEPPPSGIVGWWPGEGNANDISGNNNNGIASPGMGYTTGEVGEAFSMDSTNANFYVPASPSLDVGSHGTGLTIEGWIKPSNVNGLQPIAEWNNSSDNPSVQGNGGIQFWIGQNPSSQGVLCAFFLDTNSLNNADNQYIQVPSPSGALVPNVWQHVAVTYDPTSGNITLYINGAVVASQYWGQFVPQTSYNLWIGHRPGDLPGAWTYGTYLSGPLDELSLYNRALTANEIAAIYQAGSAGKCPTTQTNFGVPVITGFSPPLGTNGTVVNISGQNFSSLPANNIVYFGAVQAVVSSASPTNLVVTLPAGATFAPITETVNGLTAYSQKPFVPTFIGSTTNFSLGPQLVLPAGSSPSGVVIADLDGDGKPDLAVDNGNNGTIDVYRNISTTGTITSNSFAPPVVLPIGTGGSSPMIVADLTGDGKLDLICQDANSNLIVVIKNLCTPGNITSNSFAPAVTFAVGNGPRGMAVQDLDGDGKPEIVSANWTDSSVSVLRNTSTPGVINTNSFAPPVTFATGTEPQNVMIADIDGDGQPDLVTVDNNYYNNSPGFSVLRNVSTPGNIAFQTHVDFAGRQDTYCIAIGDLDGDGKPDVVIGSQGGNGPNGNMVSIYLNTSTPGSITTNSFAPEVDITPGGWVNSVALADLNGDGKLDIAAVMQLPSQMEVLINNSAPGSVSFASPQVFASGWNANGIAVGDLNGDGIPDIAFANSYDGTISVYQNLTAPGGAGAPPFITIQPTNDVVTVGGTATFSVTATGTAPLSYQWYFDSTSITGATNSILTLNNAQTNEAGGYYVTVANAYGSTNSATATLTVNSSSSFNIPVITAFNPALGATGTVVNISGLNFSPTASSNIVYFGSVQAMVSAASPSNLVVTVPAGAIFAPITETVNGLTAYSQTPFLPTFPGNSALSANTFAASFNLPADDGPVRVIAADVDGDGKPDLIVADDYGDDVLIYRNISSNGTLNANSFAPPVELPVGPVVSAADAALGLAVGDLSGDGQLDIVVANEYTSEISIFQNLSSPGVLTSNSFGARIDIPVAGNPAAVAVSDMDGDGKPDLLTVNLNNNSVSVLQNISTQGVLLSSNSFAAPVSFDTGPQPYTLAVGDLDGDGKPDVITGSANTGSLTDTISVLRNVSTPGNIVLQAHQDFAGLGQANSIAIGDLDGDGIPDVVVSSGQSGQAISVYRNTSSPGAVTLAAPVNFPLGGWGNTIAIGDMDGDGKPDIAVETQLPSQICLFRNISSPGNFTSNSLAPVIVLPSGWNPNGIALADLAGDGRPDLIFANTYDGTLSIAQNVSGFGGTPTNLDVPAIAAISPTLGTNGTLVNISGQNFSPSTSSNIVYFGAVQATVDFATPTNLVVTVPAGATFAPITETVNGLTAYSQKPFVPTFLGTGTNSALGPQLVLPAGSGPYDVVIADLDGDGKPDIAIDNGSSHTIEIYQNISAGGTITSSSFAPPVILPIGTGGQNTMVAADLTGDGKLDLLCDDENSNLLVVIKNLCTPGNITSNSFAPAVTFAVGTDPRGVAVQDLDGDGKPEIVVPNCGDSTLSIFRNTSTPGIIDTNSFAPPIVVATGLRPQNVMISDIDGDGQPDLVTVNNNYYSNSSGMSVLRNISTPGNIALQSHVDFPGRQDTYCIAIGDLDGDGKPDVVIGSQGGHGPNGDMVSIYRNTSTPGTITTNSFAPEVDIAAGGWVNSVALGDLNGDGKLDIAAAMQIPSQMEVLINKSTPGSISNNSFDSPLVFASGYNANGIAVGDLNGDGMPDIAFANNYDGTLSIYQNLGGLIATSPPPIIVTQVLDHFAWNPITSPKFRGLPFTVGITARDTNNDIVTNYTGLVFITLTNHAPVEPPESGRFVQGAWTGTLMIPITGTNLVLSAGAIPVAGPIGHVGYSNPFNVIVGGPMLHSAPVSGTLQFTWAAGTPGFILETTTNLSSGPWVPVPGQPVLSGNEYIQQIPPGSNSGVFYRLHYQ